MNLTDEMAKKFADHWVDSRTASHMNVYESKMNDFRNALIEAYHLGYSTALEAEVKKLLHETLD